MHILVVHIFTLLLHPTGCGFNFSIGEVSDYERFRRAELRIRMRQPTGDQVNSVYLQLYYGNRKGSDKKVSPIREGWIVFDVINEVNQWRMDDHSNGKIHFQIITYTSEVDLARGKNGKNCHKSAIKFNQPSDTDDDDDIDNKPLLMIYSHDLDVIKFNVSALIDAHVGERHRRQYSELSPLAHSCGKHNLQINLTTFNNIWQLGEKFQTALQPDYFDINVCGGQCNRDIPNASAQHSLILYYLYTRGHTTSYENTNWGQCCVPIKYRSIPTLFDLHEGVIRIVLLRDISVDKCSCLSILQPNSGRR